MRRIFRSALVGGLASLVVLSSAGVALADNALGDGDGAVPLSTNVLDFGANVCVGSTVTKNVALGLIRSGNDTGTNTFANSASVSFSIQGMTGSGLSAAMGSPASITLPSNWTSIPNNTTSPTAAIGQVTLVASAPGTVSGNLSFRAEGPNTDRKI